jgi:hypothetical protein
VDVLPAINLEPWEEAVGAFFALCMKEIEGCSVHLKLLLSESGKTFISVKNAVGNYR